jgi:hypothetical protein
MKNDTELVEPVKQVKAKKVFLLIKIILLPETNLKCSKFVQGHKLQDDETKWNNHQRLMNHRKNDLPHRQNEYCNCQLYIWQHPDKNKKNE